jgi:hypothetical protein
MCCIRLPDLLLLAVVVDEGSAALPRDAADDGVDVDVVVGGLLVALVALTFVGFAVDDDAAFVVAVVVVGGGGEGFVVGSFGFGLRNNGPDDIHQ